MGLSRLRLRLRLSLISAPSILPYRRNLYAEPDPVRCICIAIADSHQGGSVSTSLRRLGVEDVGVSQPDPDAHALRHAPRTGMMPLVPP